ncbi:MAG TPA: tetratricopeptide repeat protein [Bacillota bacterium]|nr:tetratricopeptide repeat protein [Bacillota bacterium]
MNNIERAYELMKNNEYELALDMLEKSLRTASIQEKFAIAEVYQMFGFLEQAKHVFQALHERFPEETDIILSLAQIYIDQEDDEKAINLLMKVDENDPQYLQSLIQLADLYEVQGLYEVSEEKLLEAKQIAPDEPIIDFALGELLFSIGKYARSITYYERVLTWMEVLNDVSIHLRLAEAYAGIGQYEKALQFYHLVDDDHPDTLFKHGLTAYYAKERQLAIQQWRKLLAQDKHYHSAYVFLVKAYKDAELLEEAFEVATDGLHIDAYNKELYYLAGKLAYQRGKTTDSIHYMSEAIALDPEYKEAVLFLVNYYKEQSQYEQLIDLLQDLKQMNVQDPLYDWELAKAYVEIEAYHLAATTYENVYPLLKHDEQFLREYAYFLVEEGKIKDAIKIFKKYLTIEKNDHEISLYVERLLEDDYS